MRSMIKRRIYFLLVFSMIFSIFTVTVFTELLHALPFADVPQDAWYHSAVEHVYRNNIMQGTSPTTFEPNVDISRAMAAATLFRLEHGRMANAQDSWENPFEDVPPNVWFAPYVSWAHSNGIVSGLSDVHFAPHDAVTREQFAAMSQRYAHLVGLAYPSVWQLYDFPDYDAVSEWARSSMNTMLVLGTIKGTDEGNLNPRGNISHAEAAQILMNLSRILSNQMSTLSRELQSQILTEWLRRSYGEQPIYDGTNARIALYLGTYADSVVVVIDDIFRGVRATFPITVSGLTFEYGNRIMVWRDSEFRPLMTINWAYEEGRILADWISADDIQAIHALTLKKELPRPMLLEDLPVQTEEKITTDFRELNSISEDYFVWVSNYLGTYNGKVAVVIDGYFDFPTVPAEETIAGITFHYSNAGPFIMIWYDGEFHSLRQSYDLALVTKDDLEAIRQRWNQRFGPSWDFEQ